MSTDRCSQHCIDKILENVERTYPVRVLFVAESGSRAWGFSSPDSDYDVRFVYVSTMNEYFTVNPRRDVIERDEILTADSQMDLSGWDVRKFLQLLGKSNPACFEWLQSQLVYRETEEWAWVRQMARPFFSPKAAMHHYLSMARHNYREHMRDGQAPSVKLKKYLYITRSLLCARWLTIYPTGGPPPMPFEDVLRASQIPNDLSRDLRVLVEMKKNGYELEEGPAVPRINEFIDTELSLGPSVADQLPGGCGNPRSLDSLFATIARR